MYCKFVWPVHKIFSTSCGWIARCADWEWNFGRRRSSRRCGALGLWGYSAWISAFYYVRNWRWTKDEVSVCHFSVTIHCEWVCSSQLVSCNISSRLTCEKYKSGSPKIVIQEAFWGRKNRNTCKRTGKMDDIDCSSTGTSGGTVLEKLQQRKVSDY